jgi:hypothetical protein
VEDLPNSATEENHDVIKDDTEVETETQGAGDGEHVVSSEHIDAVADENQQENREQDGLVEESSEQLIQELEGIQDGEEKPVELAENTENADEVDANNLNDEPVQLNENDASEQSDTDKDTGSVTSNDRFKRKAVKPHRKKIEGDMIAEEEDTVVPQI